MENRKSGAPEQELMTHAPLIAHLVELRRRVIIAILAWGAGFVLCFLWAQPLYNLLLIPYVQAVPTGVAQLIYTAPQEFFFTHLKLALFGGFVLAFPIIAAQAYFFVAPGLYLSEKRAFLPFLIAAPLLFITGGALVFFGVLPLALRFFLSFQQDPGPQQAMIALLPQVSAYLSLTIALICGFGLVFQLPVVLTLLVRAGIITSRSLKEKRKYAVISIFLLAAFLTPPDPLTQIILAVPALLLYEVSIFCGTKMEKKTRFQGNCTERERA